MRDSESEDGARRSWGRSVRAAARWGQRAWRWCVLGSDELTLPRAWLENRERLRRYEAYTYRQLQQGCVVSDAAAMRRRAFWRRIAASAAERETRARQARVVPLHGRRDAR